MSSESDKKLEIRLASPRGFCAGVERAIETVKLALKEHGEPVYVLHEIVHNRHVIDNLRQGGAVFVEELEQIPAGAICIFSAHGVSLQIEKRAKALGLKTIDATCPLVSSVHRMVEKYHAEGCSVVIIGHHRHPEVEGTAGRVTGEVYVVATAAEAEKLQVNNSEKIAFVTQTTLAENDIEQVLVVLRRRFPLLQGPKSNICFATQNRQNAVRTLARCTDLILVVGSKNSSNSNRLREVGTETGTPAYLIDDFKDLKESWFRGCERVGITAGASAPESLVEGVVVWLLKRGRYEITEMTGQQEKVHFKAASLID
ncbi:4-hydroxy-3-methylbut-2-enyl diphosphate reductase [Desulfotalea psychrophila]|uniref:4-hydroxy-3-methylbut-2-enyl diphosphate reductase n=1 Tax=Desulfotalea psychrophila (strain LSv54 / DSM 12343) TaxID=177439 RepID=ISPH_DESPS|nr:4-hydroxy-3-methylbut-2-enyl diphosphate reductase [Desulfotalea psychrophila]Q6AL80.1 RecName: Full=4-hydroxy-3-methylbut-2-enyl diphosphate reductase; Short=HMBPP reductase [Desulfotalea psychrophila LSv54]CAG36895.1 probable LytB protein [Desulfotalea psychrophila LSv54]